MQTLARLLPDVFSSSNSDESPRHRTIQQRARNWLFVRLRSRRHRAVLLLLLLLVLCCVFAALMATQLLPQHRSDWLAVEADTDWTTRGPVAYVTLLCDERRPDPALVLAAGLLNLSSTAPLIVLAFAPLDSATRRQLLHPASGIAEVRERTRRSDTQAAGDSQQADRCSTELTLELWSLTEYSRIVFLDAERVLPLQPLDALFSSWPQLSAAQDAAGQLDAAVMVLEPSAAVHSELVDAYFSFPSAYDGVRGFLQSAFTDAATVQPLPMAYSLSLSLSQHRRWPELLSAAHLVLFTEEVKPWSIFASAQPDWQRDVDGRLFHLWTQRRQRLYGSVLSTSAHELSASFSSPAFAALNLSLPGVAHVRHLDAASAVCSSAWPVSASLRADRYSVVLGSVGHSERIAILLRLIPHYLSSPHVDRVFLTWHRPNLSVPAAIAALLSSQQLQLLPMTVDSLNNRFLPPVSGLRTRAVYIADDDVRIPIADIDRAFMLWRTNPQQLVGFFPRSHIPVARPDLSPPWTYQYTLHTLGRVPGYSMVLTKGFFCDSVFLYCYSCLLPTKAHAYVNLVMNCEDILFNMMVSGMTGLPPLALATEVDEYGGFTGLSQGKDHVELRGDCLTDFTRMLGGEMTLKYSSAFVHAYPEKDAVHYIKKSISQWPEK